MRLARTLGLLLSFAGCAPAAPPANSPPSTPSSNGTATPCRRDLAEARWPTCARSSCAFVVTEPTALCLAPAHPTRSELATDGASVEDAVEREFEPWLGSKALRDLLAIILNAVLYSTTPTPQQLVLSG